MGSHLWDPTRCFQVEDTFKVGPDSVYVNGLLLLARGTGLALGWEAGLWLYEEGLQQIFDDDSDNDVTSLTYIGGEGNQMKQKPS